MRFIAGVIEPLWFPLLFAYAFIPLLIVRRENWKDIGLKKPQNIKYVFIGMVFSVITKVLTITILFNLFETGSLNWMYGIVEHYKNIPGMPIGIIAVVLLFTVGVPIAEEVFFRMF